MQNSPVEYLKIFFFHSNTHSACAKRHSVLCDAHYKIHIVYIFMVMKCPIHRIFFHAIQFNGHNNLMYLQLNTFVHVCMENSNVSKPV